MIARHQHAVEVLEKSYAIVFFGVLAALFIALVCRRVALATPGARRTLSPLLLAAVAVGLRAAYELVSTFGDESFAKASIFWLQALAFVALPIALLDRPPPGRRREGERGRTGRGAGADAASRPA